MPLVPLEVLRAAYTQMTMEEMAKTYGISVQTIYYHKRADAKKGIYWEELKLAKLTSREEQEASEARFISTLISSFEAALEAGGDIDIEMLNKYATTYWRLKAPPKTDGLSAKINEKELALKVVKAIAAIAKELGAKEVLGFLNENAELIASKIVI